MTLTLIRDVHIAQGAHFSPLVNVLLQDEHIQSLDAPLAADYDQVVRGDYGYLLPLPAFDSHRDTVPTDSFDQTACQLMPQQTADLLLLKDDPFATPAAVIWQAAWRAGQPVAVAQLQQRYA
ncbi:MAG: hypothetical protein LKJ69_09695 [Lactobacillus sp.]|jgi:hypothetical protein|nr:hypothetical protein [Lactobacillus sp.]MCI2033634.1 hypothetical protein [Lactobacillus sp.]